MVGEDMIFNTKTKNSLQNDNDIKRSRDKSKRARMLEDYHVMDNT